MKYLDVIKRHLQFGNRKLVFTREGFDRFQLLWNTIKKRMITGFDYSEIISCDFDPDTYRLVKVVVKVDGHQRRLTFIQSTYNAELDMTTENCVIDLKISTVMLIIQQEISIEIQFVNRESCGPEGLLVIQVCQM